MCPASCEVASLTAFTEPPERLPENTNAAWSTLELNTSMSAMPPMVEPRAA